LMRARAHLVAALRGAHPQQRHNPRLR
jgi:hypothetical protein